MTVFDSPPTGVADATAGLSLQIPSWVPPAVADVARRHWHYFKSRVEYAEEGTKLLSRLICDERMRSVWRELSRRRRDGEFMYPVRSKLEKNKDTRQSLGMATLFGWGAIQAMVPGEVVTCQKAEQRHKEILDKAKQLRADAWNLYLQSIDRSTPLSESRLSFSDHEKRLRDLYHAAQILESYAEENLAFDMRTALKRDRGDGDIRWAALGLAKVCRSVFGSPMYSVTATIVSVALDRDIDARTIRQWCAHPADKPPKTVR